MSDKDPMARTDMEFKAYVCNSLRELNDKHTELESKMVDHIALTQDIAEIVRMGRGMFKFAYRVGSFIRWIGGFAAGAMLIWHFFSDHIKETLK